jgi:putative restriction endonuclease
MQINQEKRAYEAWIVLINCASKKEKITYKNLGEKIGIHHRAVKHPLERIQTYCLEEKLPPLTILVTNQSGQVGQGFIAWDIDDYETGFMKVCEYSWELIDNPFSYARDNTTEEDLIDDLLQKPEESEKIYSKVQNRGIAQKIFRQTLLKAYDNKCAFTGLSYIDGLEAAHIVPWANATAKQRLDVRNGLLLNAFHHKLFDTGFITFNEKYEIVCDENLYSSVSEYDRLMIDNLCGRKVNLPQSSKHYPLKENIQQANEIIKKRKNEIG